LTPIEAAAALAGEHGLRHDEIVVLKHGSNLLVRLAPAPVVLRIATFTARIRGDPLPYLEREVALVSHLAAAGASVMRPSDVIPPGPHVVGGWAMSAWRYVAHEAGAIPDAITVLNALDDLHAALRTYSGELPLLNPAGDDLDRALAFAEAHGVYGHAQADELRARRDDVMIQLLAASPGTQALHGDAFPRNTLLSPSGVIWIDFEDCCSGPILWDLAVLIRQGGGPRVADIVRRRHGDEAVRLAITLRGFQAQVWTALHDARTAHGW
jgi:Ser/Thr protein kinase RdoA (MazF antagonist)